MNDDGRTKYQRMIYDCRSGKSNTAVVDVYSVCTAFRVACPARQHAIKKILCAGLRGKGDASQDLREAISALERAITIEAKQELKDE